VGNHARTSAEAQCALRECICELNQVLRYFPIGALMREPQASRYLRNDKLNISCGICHSARNLRLSQSEHISVQRSTPSDCALAPLAVDAWVIFHAAAILLRALKQSLRYDVTEAIDGPHAGRMGALK
jgi:hypothetical protein